MLMNRRYSGRLWITFVLYTPILMIGTAFAADDTSEFHQANKEPAHQSNVQHAPRNTADLKALQRDVRALRDDVRRLSKLLEKRSASGQIPRPAKPADHDHSTPLPVETQHTEIQAALLKPISLEFIDTPLRDVMRKINELLHVNVVIDSQSLLEAGLEETHRVSIVLSGVSARSALKMILELLQLTFIENEEVLKIVNSERATGELTTVIYAVADLIVPLPDGPGSRTKVITSDWLKLIDLITKDVEPKNWAFDGGPCSIQALGSTMSLIVRATPKMHEAIAKLFRGMRREQDLQVTVAFNLLKITDNEILYKAGIKFEFDPDTGMSRLDEHDGKKLIAAVQSGKGESTFAPKITMFNGQVGFISDLLNQGGRPLSYQLHVRGKVSDDRRSVRLSVALNPESLVNDLINNSHRLEDGGSLLLDLTDGPPVQKRSSNPHGSIDLTRDANRHPAPIPSKRRLVSNLVLIQPRIIIQEEEEEQLATPIRDVERK